MSSRSLRLPRSRCFLCFLRFCRFGRFGLLRLRFSRSILRRSDVSGLRRLHGRLGRNDWLFSRHC
ncbi:hypothetical protein Hanom_Chr15g01347261 [Helianthus anomalus]